MHYKTYLILALSILPGLALGANFSDLTLDTRFGAAGHGITTLDYTSADGGSTDRPVAVLPKIAGQDLGWWVVANHSNGGSDATFEIFDLSPTGAETSVSTSVDPVIAGPVDAIIADVSGERRIFILGTVSGSSGTLDFGIKCLNVSGGTFQGDCPNWGPFGRSYAEVNFGLGPTKNDFAQRLAYYNSYLYATGFVDDGSGSTADFAVGVAKVSASDGTLADGWGNLAAQNGLFVKNINYQTGGTDVPYAIVVGPANPLGVGGLDLRVDVFVAGASTVAANDNDGWIMAIDENLTSGERLDPEWNNGNIRPYYFDLGTTKKQDQITALTQRHNGNLLFAGYAEDDDDTELVLGELKPDGTPLASFCGGGVCHSLYTSLHEVPVAIAERLGAGNFVVALDNTDDYDGDGHPVAAIYQFHYNGKSLDSLQDVDLNASDTRQNATYATALIVDPVSTDALLTGWSRYTLDPPADSGDDDGFVTWYRADNTVFANGFGGAYRD